MPIPGLIRLCSFYLFVIPLAATTAFAQPQYEISTIGDYITVYGINESNVVTGDYRYTSFIRHAYSQDGDVLTDLGTLGGGFSYGYAINDAGAVVGASDATSGPRNGFIHSSGVMQSIDTAYTNTVCSQESYVRSINNAGEIAGDCRVIALNEKHAFVTINGVVTPLGTLQNGFGSFGEDINASGEVAGWSKIDSLDPVSGSWQNRAFVTIGGTMTDLGTLPGDTNSWANAINDAGEVVGFSFEYVGVSYPWDEIGTAFLWDGSSLVDLGKPAGASTAEAHDINNQGQVVGSTLFPAESSLGAFYYDEEVGNVDLRTLIVDMKDWVVLYDARAINDQGVIVGHGIYDNGQNNISAAYMLTPVPEPSATLGLLTGWLVVARMRRGHRPQGA